MDLCSELLCSLCDRIYEDPVTLTCGHSFCLRCLDRTWHYEDYRKKKCPECNKKFHGRPELKKDVKLRNIVEAYSQQQQLGTAKGKQREELRDVLNWLSSKKASHSKTVQTLVGKTQDLQKEKDEISKKITILLKEIRKQTKILEQKILGAISSWYEEATLPIHNLIIKLEKTKDELEKKIHQHIDGMTSATRDYSEILERSVVDTETLGEKAGDLPLALISEILYTGLSDLVAGIYIEEPRNISLDIEALHMQTSDDLNSLSKVPRSLPEISRRCQLHPQALCTSSISSAQHTWEVGSSASGVWRVGVYYSSMQSSANQFSIGNNKKSWCLRRYKNDYSVMHDNNEEQIPYVSSRNGLRMHLDYDIGQLSFYELSDPIRHLHTFTTTFSEPLHAAFCVWRNTSEGFPLDIFVKL